MGGVLPWQKSCDIVSGCIYFIGEMIWCVQPQFSTSYGFFSHVKSTQLYLGVEGLFGVAILNPFLLQINIKKGKKFVVTYMLKMKTGKSFGWNEGKRVMLLGGKLVGVKVGTTLHRIKVVFGVPFIHLTHSIT